MGRHLWRSGDRVLLLAVVGMGLVGCASDPRPRTAIAPTGVQEEIRDARAFLAYPDPTVGPASELNPRDNRIPASTR